MLWLGSVMLIVLVVRWVFISVLVSVWWWVVSVFLMWFLVWLMCVFLDLCVFGLSLFKFLSKLVSMLDLLRKCVFLFFSEVLFFIEVNVFWVLMMI